LEQEDFEAVKTLFNDSYSEYLAFLKNESYEEFVKAVKEREETEKGLEKFLKIRKMSNRNS
jgi:hypothetical protein